jgi:hypothetical protein
MGQDFLNNDPLAVQYRYNQYQVPGTENSGNRYRYYRYNVSQLDMARIWYYFMNKKLYSIFYFARDSARLNTFHKKNH